MNNLRSEMASVLEKNFGYTAFRPNQEEVIEALLVDRDVFVLMPTGGGKSLCYQIPALMKDGTAVIISPLISLMKDQVDGLVSNGIDAAYLNSTLSESESIDIKRRLLDGALKILYVAPERLMMKGMISLLKKIKVSLFAIDEAHCVSEWGHDFRPEYRQLSQLKDLFPDTCIAALTATATERVRRDIVHVLRLNEPVIKISSFSRPNLSYQIVEKKDVMKQLDAYLRKNRNKSGIIYCQSRDTVERLALQLSKAGFSALPYHAGLSDERRARNQDRFIQDDTDIIVATVAFGMGIDKPDVRFVIHYDLPKNLESYYQETGRGGRDGLECECILFFSRGDWHKIRFLIEKKPSKKERDLAFQQLSQIISYCESTDCRRNVLLRYFGEDIKEPCNNCDSCFHPRSKVDGTEEAILLMECVSQTGQRFGMSHIVDVLYGSRTQKVKEMRHDKLAIHGAGKSISKNEWKRIGNELIQSGCLSVGGDKYPVIKLNPSSRKVMAGEMKIELTEPPISRISKGKTILPGAAAEQHTGGEYIDEAENIFDDGNEDFIDENEGFGDGSEDFGDGSEDFGDGSEGFGDGSEGFGDGSEDFGDGSEGFGDVSGDFGDGSEGFGDGSEGFGDVSEDFGDVSEGFGDVSGDFGEVSEDFEDGIYRGAEEETSGSIVYGGKKSILADGIDDRIETAVKKERKAALGKDRESVFANGGNLTEKETEQTAAKRVENGKFDSVLFNRLRQLRKKIATDKNLPPYIIFADTSLRQMATDYPADDASFLKIIGVAEYKLQKYGGLFINEIADYLREAEAAPRQSKTKKNATLPLGDAGKPEAVNLQRGAINLPREAINLPREAANLQPEAAKPSDGTITAANSSINEKTFSEDDLKKTRNLFSQGLSVSEISEIRGLTIQKIMEHLEALIAAGKIDNVDFLISEKVQKEISGVIAKLQIEFTEKLMNSIVIEKSDIRCSEEEVRIVKALLIAEMKRRKS